MGKLTIFELLSLDGVMQAPARSDEDPRGGFEHGGWAVPYAGMTGGNDRQGESHIVLGRRTYEDFYSVWPQRVDDPTSAVLDNAQKYVVSKTLSEPLPWRNSTLLKGDGAESVARLKRDLDKDLVVLGSRTLVHTLMRHKLIDVYVLLIHPLVLGSGGRLFPDDGTLASLQLVETHATPTGVIMATYRSVEE